MRYAYASAASDPHACAHRARRQHETELLPSADDPLSLGVARDYYAPRPTDGDGDGEAPHVEGRGTVLGAEDFAPFDEIDVGASHRHCTSAPSATATHGTCQLAPHADAQ